MYAELLTYGTLKSGRFCIGLTQALPQYISDSIQLHVYILCPHFDYKHTQLFFISDSHELNLSAAESAFSFVPHYRPLPSHPPTAFRVRVLLGPLTVFLCGMVY